MEWLEIVNVLLITWFILLILAGIVFLVCYKCKTSAHVISIFDMIAILLLVCMKPYMLLGFILSILHFVLKFY